jgi:hypothetical protein
MHPNASSVPAPGGPQPQPAPLPGPAIVPPREAPPRRRRGLWTALLALALVGGGAAYYLQQSEAAKLASKGGGGVITVSTAVVGLGDLHATVRVNGTIAAQNFASLLAPRIQGSRSGMNRGGDGGGRGGGGGGGGGAASTGRKRLPGSGVSGSNFGDETTSASPLLIMGEVKSRPPFSHAAGLTERENSFSSSRRLRTIEQIVKNSVTPMMMPTVTVMRRLPVVQALQQ